MPPTKPLYEDSTRRLEEAWEASAESADRERSKWHGLAATVFEGSELAPRFALLTQLLIKLALPEVDSRSLEPELPPGTSPRSLAKNVVVPFDRAHGSTLGGSADPYVSNPLRPPRADIREEADADNAQPEWKALAAILAAVESGEVSADATLQAAVDVIRVESVMGLQALIEQSLALQVARLTDEAAFLRRGHLIEYRGPSVIAPLLANGLEVEGSVGVGTDAEIPWLRIFDRASSPSAQAGWYLAYLFAADGSAAYLALMQGITNASLSEIRAGVETARATLGARPSLEQHIDLRSTQGATSRPARYEQSVVYAIRYETGAVPSDEQLKDDLGLMTGLLAETTTVGDVIDEGLTGQGWVFQANPEIYAIDRAIRKLPKIEWTVRQHGADIKTGDRVYLWRSGHNAGIVATGRVATDPADRPPDNSEHAFYLQPEMFAESEPRVDVEITAVLEPELSKATLAEHEVLKEMKVIRMMGRGTNFGLTPEEDAALQALLATAGQAVHKQAVRPPAEPFTVDAIIAAATRAPRNLELPREIYESVHAALESGKHVILTGPPGTAKTTLAEAVAEAAERAHRCDGYVLTTATADWTTYETIGGLRPQADGTLTFAAGHFLEAIESDRWLVIDELNRSNFDRAFGQLFTVLSGQAVQLPYERHEGQGRLILAPHGTGSTSPNVLSIPSGWRIIATMNVFDKSLLFEMSFALMRRFAFIEVAAPSGKVFARLIDQSANGNVAAAEITKSFLPLRAEKDLGPAIFMDMARYLSLRVATGADRGQVGFEAFYSYLLPQFEGIDQITGERVYSTVKRLVGSSRAVRLQKTLNTVLGLEINSAAASTEEDEPAVEPDTPEIVTE